MDISKNYKGIDKTSIRLIINTIDVKLKERNKSYASLAFANELLIENGILSKEDQQNNVLKKMLEKGMIPHAYQTERRPKQWRIPISDKGRTKKAKKKTKANSLETPRSYDSYTTCPNCKIYLTISKEISSEQFLTCLNCGTTFLNPLIKESINHEPAQGWYSQLNYKQKVGFKRLIIICAIALIFILVSVITDSRPQLIKSLDEEYIGREWTDYTYEYFNNHYGPGRPLYYHDQMWVYYYPKGDFTLRVSKKNNRIIRISSGAERR